MSLPRSNQWESHWTLLTGATGFIGQHLLSRLLQNGRRVMIGARGELEAAWARLLAAPALADAQLVRRRRHGQIELLRVELGVPIEPARDQHVNSVVHAAGCV